MYNSLIHLSLAEHVAKRHQPKPSKEPKGKQGRKKHQQAQSEAENEAGEVPELRERASTVTIKQIHHMGRQADITSHISASAVKLKPLPLLQRSYTPHSARSRLFESSTDIERARRAQTQVTIVFTNPDDASSNLSTQASSLTAENS